MLSEVFRQYLVDPVFNRKTVTEVFFHPERDSKESAFLFGTLEQTKPQGIFDVLSHPEIQTLIEEGKITLAAVKPKTEESRLGVASDIEGEKKLLKMIKPPLSVIFNLSVALSSDDIENFYPEDIKARIKSRVIDGRNDWDDFKDYMTSGPITYCLLYSPDGKAVEEWRRQMGTTNPKDASLGTIRRDYALSIKQNLVHGSDSTASVKREVNWLKGKIQALLKDTDKYLEQTLDETTLRSVGVLSKEEQLLLVKRLRNFERRGSETFLAAYTIVSIDNSGEVQVKYLAQKSIVSFPCPEQKAQAMFQRLQMLSYQGVSTPRIYGLSGADIYEEYIVSAKSAEQGIALIKSERTPANQKKELLLKLVKIAAILDHNGFVHVGNFWNSLIFDGEKFLLVDTGSDLGSPDLSRPHEFCKGQLISTFQGCGFDDFINQEYKKLRTN